MPTPSDLLTCGADSTLTGVWDQRLVVLSGLVAIGGSFAGLDCADRMRSATNIAQRRKYFLAGASLIGVSVWTMHFVGMLAHNLGVPVSYDPALSAISIVAAAFGAGLAFLIVNRPMVTRTHVVCGGVAMGLAIATMHYLGMASMRMPATIRYIPVWFLASVVLAIAASIGALFLARRPLVPGPTGYWLKASSAVVLGLAIAGMHYVGMAAACYEPASLMLGQNYSSVGLWTLQDLLLVAGVVIVVALLVLAAKNAADRQFALASLDEQRRQAVDALRAKESFLASLSHELRTPLNPALLMATDGAHNPEFSKAARDAFAAIAHQITLEARLIDDLLDLTRHSRGLLRVERKAANVHAVLQNSLATVRADLQAKSHELQVDLTATNSWAELDASRMQQVFCNLLLNAGKYTPAGGRITVTSRDAGEQLEITVADNGRGMTPAELARCFDRFAQGDHRLGGLGLGLSISKSLVDLHEGTLAAASAGRNQGAHLTVTLATIPAPDASATPLPSTPPFMSATPGLRLLLVEDHAASRAAVELLLRKRGYHVTAVGSVADALQAGIADRHDILISDLGLPDGDGYALLEKLGVHAPAVKIAMTGFGATEDVNRTRDAGFLVHLTKPVTLKKLDESLREAERASASPDA